MRRAGVLLGRGARGVTDAALAVATVRPVAKAGYWVAGGAARAWGRILGGAFERHGRLTTVTGLPKWAFGRGGTCVGDVVLSHHALPERALAHEEVHRQQWERYGLAMIPLYFAAGLDPLTNRFEIEAGLQAGGYVKVGAEASPRN